MPQRVIIAGGGRIGARTATILGSYGQDTIIVERDSDRCEQLVNECGGVIIGGDATRAEVLTQADPDRADVFAALTGDLGTNRRLCDRVKALTDGIRTVARTPDLDEQVAAADRTVVPIVAGAKATADAIFEHGHWIRDRPAGGFDLIEVDIDPRAPAATKHLREVGFPDGSHVVADSTTMDVAGPATKLRPGHEYLVAVEHGAAADVRNLFRG